MDAQPDHPSGADAPPGGSRPSRGQQGLGQDPGQGPGPAPEHSGQPPQDPAQRPQDQGQPTQFPAQPPQDLAEPTPPQDQGQPPQDQAEPAQPQDPAQPPQPTQYPGRPVIAATGTGRSQVRPGRVWYLVALAVFLVGVAWIVLGLISVGRQVDSFPRVPLPTGGTVALDHSGGYVIYYEGPGASRGRVPSFHVRISPAAPPAAVGSSRSYSSSVTYSFGSHQGRAVLTLQVVHPGRFRVETSGAPAVAGGSDLAFGSSIAGRVAGTVLPSIALIFLGIVGAIVVGLIRTNRVRRARTQGF